MEGAAPAEPLFWASLAQREPRPPTASPATAPSQGGFAHLMCQFRALWADLPRGLRVAGYFDFIGEKGQFARFEDGLLG